jgi:hypothetical protein
MLAEAICTKRPIQYGCRRVNNGCWKGSNGTNTSHSDAEENTAQGVASRKMRHGESFAVQRPSMPKNTTAQEKSAH